MTTKDPVPSMPKGHQYTLSKDPVSGMTAVNAYSFIDMEAYGDARVAHARKVALEEALAACESEHVGNDVNDHCRDHGDDCYNRALRHAASAIKDLMK